MSLFHSQETADALRLNWRFMSHEQRAYWVRQFDLHNVAYDENPTGDHMPVHDWLPECSLCGQNHDAGVGGSGGHGKVEFSEEVREL